ncbi:hypothetical protein [Gluconobacter kondonii]|uniref:hypothetical protein n=1 Tax=Gluconobacter kondonii TaxID=941463 RepID=UPI001B8C0EAB|nr:hypothetical protein [Gluconobacter kondonii]MBS1057145.1 hypothetical protein [Gluconobacter kondonii]
MSARRWAKFWWQDWQRDPALRMCSLAARGAWIEMLCLMADADPVGHLLVNGRSPNMRQLSAVLGCSEREATKLVAELEENGVFSRSEDGTIFSRRMVRDKAISDEAAANGKKGGNPNITGKGKRKVKGEDAEGLTPSLKANATPPLKHQETEAEADTERTLSLRSSERAQNLKSEKSKRASRLPADWQPTPEQIQFAVANQVDPIRTAEVFRDYWLGVPGTKGCKADWDATWRNWVRREDGMRPQAAPSKAQQRADNAEAWKSGVMLEGY